MLSLTDALLPIGHTSAVLSLRELPSYVASCIFRSSKLRLLSRVLTVPHLLSLRLINDAAPVVIISVFVLSLLLSGNQNFILVHQLVDVRPVVRWNEYAYFLVGSFDMLDILLLNKRSQLPWLGTL